MKRLKLDLGSAYPRAVIDFNLDISNFIFYTQMPEWFPSEDVIAEAINNLDWKDTKWGKYLIEDNIIAIPVTFRETKEELINQDFKGITDSLRELVANL